MNDRDRWARVRELFERAIESPPADVDAWVRAESRGDPELRAEVLSLLEHHSRAGSFLADPAGDLLHDILADDQALAEGQTIGPYTIVRELGRGGMGRVYLAIDTRLGRRVALKALSPELTVESSHRDRLRREARAAAALTHPGICTVYALEEIDGDLFIASELVDGDTLREEIGRRSPPTVAQVVETARDLAAALAHAHNRGITHRDLKPENIIRARDGQLKILDFGLARIADPGSDIAPPRDAVTRAGAIVGTPRYMAPEQLKAHAADARTDVFAFGIVIYEYATGLHPFEAETTLVTTARILEAEPRPLREVRPDLPAPLLATVERALRKAPAERFTSGAEIASALSSGQAAPTSGAPSGGMTTWWRTHQFTAIGLYFVACGLAWQIKEWRPGMTMALFVAICVASTIAGVFRGHLLFTERVNRPGLDAERKRATPVTFGIDLLLALALALDAVALAATRPLASVLTIALGIGIALARLVVEPTTTKATFT
jgi:serine/threonine protein kinase